MKNFSRIILILIVLLGCKKEITTTPAETEKKIYNVYISSFPQGAEIFINGKNSGFITPDTVRYLDEADIKISLRKKYFNNYDTTISTASTRKLDFNFFNKINVYGQIDFNTYTRDASVYLDDVYVGKTPLRLQKVNPGVHRIKFEKVSFISKQMSVEVFSDVLTLAHFNLIDTTYWVNYRQVFENDTLNSIEKIIPFKNNSFIISTESGLYQFSKNGYKLIPEFGNYQYLNINSAEYFENKLWLGSNTGLYVMNDVITPYKGEIRLENSKIITDFEIFDQKLWISNEQGLFAVKEHTVEQFNTSNSILTNNFILSLCANNNSLFFGGIFDNLYKYSKNSLSVISKFFKEVGVPYTGIKNVQKINDNLLVITTLVQKDPKGNILVPERLILYNLGTDQFKIPKNYHQNIQFNCLKPDASGNIWVGTNYGIYIYNSEWVELQHYDIYTTKLLSQTINDIYIIDSKTVLIATGGGGLTKFKN